MRQVNLGRHPRRREVREPLDLAQRTCARLDRTGDESRHAFITHLSSRLRDAMVLYESDAKGNPTIQNSEEQADQVWSQVKNELEVKRKEGGSEWLAALEEVHAPLGGIPFTKALHPNWAQYYYMASLAMSTCVVVLDNAWLSSEYCEGEGNLFSRKQQPEMQCDVQLTLN